MVLDFDRISSVVKPFIEKVLDHAHLNDTILENPTAENIALHIYKFLTEQSGLMTGPYKDSIIKVGIQETETGWVEVGG